MFIYHRNGRRKEGRERGGRKKKGRKKIKTTEKLLSETISKKKKKERKKKKQSPDPSNIKLSFSLCSSLNIISKGKKIM